MLERLMTAVGSERGIDAANRLCEACVDYLAVDAAAISLVFDGANAATLGSSGPAGRLYDEVQFTVGEGPCLDSVSGQAPVLVPDLGYAEEVRWPAYVPVMLGHDIRGVYAVPVVVAGEYVGALDLFRASPEPLDVSEIAGAINAAELAEMPLLDLFAGELHLALADPSGLAWSELNALSRVEVNQATGMLVAQLNIEPAEALVRLRAHAYATGRSASEVSRDILERRLRLDDA